LGRTSLEVDLKLGKTTFRHSFVPLLVGSLRRFHETRVVRPRFCLKEAEAYAAIALPVGIFHDPQPKRSDPGTSKRRFA
jgi:hypothetical protein